jgi:hypothetical protein
MGHCVLTYGIAPFSDSASKGNNMTNEFVSMLNSLTDAEKVKVLGYILEGELSDDVSDALMDVRDAYVKAHDYAMDCAA